MKFAHAFGATLLSVTSLMMGLSPAQAGDKIQIYANPQQTAVQNSTQGQTAAGSGGANTQTAVNQQGIQQNQSVNIYIPENYDGKVQVRDANRGRQGHQNQPNRGNRRGNRH
ncbi:hypothetical protein [Leptolyngbya sp. FACHB-261]|uniref:hypothetical protein n=1 Tax=Leptolyngbya sp. FACHB-261 TaxID=2692806 RepID=UPI001689CBC9|nr:hypothetical protein [Leptolyngbya sp. FACHB-261]MBD2102646.1 hypothetical protein [Leptolyngbya sp. FACHB-261]